MQVSEPIFQIGQTVYMVKQARIDRGVIKELTYHITAEGESIGYLVKRDVDGREAEWPPAYMVTSLEEAKKSAITNMDTDVAKARELITALEDVNFDEARDEYARRTNAQK